MATGRGALNPLLAHRIAAAVRGPGWRRAVLVRRIAAAALTVLALALALAPQGWDDDAFVLVAMRDLEAGTRLDPADVAAVRFPASHVPAGALDPTAPVEGRIVAGPVRAGEPLTDVRLAGPVLAAVLTGDHGAATVPVRLADIGVAALLAPGGRVDVITIGAETGDPVMLAADATVLTVLPAESGQPGGGRVAGPVALLALPRTAAARVAAASLTEEVTVTLR